MSSIAKTTTRGGETRYKVYWRDPAGCLREKWFERKADADRFAHGVETDKSRGCYIDARAGRIKVADWAEVWLATKVAKKPKTLAGYRELLGSVVLPRFGKVALNGIRPSDVKKWLAELGERGLSASRVRQAFFVLSGLLTSAVDDDLIARNPASAAVTLLPPPPPKRDIFLTGEQIDRLAAAAGGAWSVLIYTMAYAGLRWGEAAGLRRSGCGLLHRRLHVVEAISEVDGRIHFVEPKSVTSARWVRIPAFLAEMLGEHLATRADQPGDPLVFAAPDGGPLRYSNFRSRVWKPAVAAAGLPESLSIHHLRHSAAALMIREGAHIELVRDQLGHSSIGVTQRYAHLYPGAAEEVAARLDHSFRERTRWVAVGLGAS